MGLGAGIWPSSPPTARLLEHQSGPGESRLHHRIGLVPPASTGLIPVGGSLLTPDLKGGLRHRQSPRSIWGHMRSAFHCGLFSRVPIFGSRSPETFPLFGHLRVVGCSLRTPRDIYKTYRSNPSKHSCFSLLRRPVPVLRPLLLSAVAGSPPRATLRYLVRSLDRQKENLLMAETSLTV